MLAYKADFVMADRIKLRICESILESLPEVLPRPVRNPMWAFLKGIEGFDNERASKCLVQLLNQHYDTVDVLRLATKQDLVEDAGILPGDALRIIAAAQEAAVDCAADLVGSTKHAREVGSESPGHAYKLGGVVHNVCPPVKKAKTGDPETLESERQGVVDQAAPRQEVAVDKAADEPAQTRPVSPLHACGACSVKCTSEQSLRSHFKDRRHAYYMDRTDHDLFPTTYLHCSICNVTCACKKNLVMHLKGKRHSRTMNEDSDSEDSDS